MASNNIEDIRKAYSGLLGFDDGPSTDAAKIEQRDQAVMLESSRLRGLLGQVATIDNVAQGDTITLENGDTTTVNVIDEKAKENYQNYKESHQRDALKEVSKNNIIINWPRKIN